MATNENQHTTGNNPGQQNPAGQRDQEGEQNAYGSDKDATNLNRDGQHSNAANQSGEGQHPNPANQGREGQQSQTNEPSKDAPYSTGNQTNPRTNENDPDGMKNVDEVIPEVPNREEKREQQIPKAGTDRPDSGQSTQGTIDDSSKFSE